MAQKEITGILIDPVTQEITEVKVPAHYKNYQHLLGVDNVEMACRGICGKNNHFLYVDEAGCHSDAPLFYINGVQHIHGKALLVSMKQGEDQDTKLTTEDVRQVVSFHFDPKNN